MIDERGRLYELAPEVSCAHPKDKLVQEFCNLVLKVLCGSRPTLKQALSMGESVGVSEEEAEFWWLSRESTDWIRGTIGGGQLPVGQNHAADLKVFTLSVRGRELSGSPINGSTSGPTKPKQETVWHLKQSLSAVEEELGSLDEKALYDGWSAKMKETRTKLKERKAELNRKISGLDS